MCYVVLFLYILQSVVHPPPSLLFHEVCPGVVKIAP